VWPIMRRVEVYTEFHKGHFEHTFSAVIHKLNVSGHMFMWTFFFLFWYVELVPKICPQLSVIFVYRRDIPFAKIYLYQQKVLIKSS
jgi:hypothetical protein